MKELETASKILVWDIGLIGRLEGTARWANNNEPRSKIKGVSITEESK